MVKVIFTKTHCIALCNRGHMIKSATLEDFPNSRFYDLILKNQSAKRTKLDDLSEQCNGFGH